MKKSRLTKAAAESAAAATEAGRNIWDDAVERAAAILLEAQRKAAPLARKAGKRTADFASKRLDTWEQQALHKAAGHKPAPVKNRSARAASSRSSRSSCSSVPSSRAPSRP